MKVSVNSERGNVNVRFEDTRQLEISPEWQLGVRTIYFAWIPAGQSLALSERDQRTLVKVIAGGLIEPQRFAFCEPKGRQNNLFEGDQLLAGENGALVTIVREDSQAPSAVLTMQELGFSGPHSEALQWRTFEQQYGEVTGAFDGADAYVGPGFHLLDASGEETCFLNIWTAGKGVDLTTHNHGHNPSPLAPAFAETHMVICNGTGSGGMYECDAPGFPKTRYPLPAGYEHGPFFEIDEASGLPVMRENGAVAYPWHGWEAGTDDDPQQSYDLVFAFETSPLIACRH